MKNRNEFPIFFAIKHKEMEVRLASRSGGAFTAISDYVLNNNGVVYGCVLNEQFDVIHCRTTSHQTRNLMRGSKYVESKIGDIFRQVKKDLNDRRMVLFTGTSCQVAGLKSFIGENNNLICVDILCHGVPSRKIWKSYLKWQEHKNGRCVKFDFRNKIDFGWKDHVETLTFESGKKVHSRVFKTLFYGNYILRPSCYHCEYKKMLHSGDITIADYWEIDRALPGFNDNKGVSLVMVNNEKGNDIFEKIKNDIICYETDIEKSTRPSMFVSANQPEDRNLFWRDINKYDFVYIAKKYGGYGVINKIKRKLKRVLLR